MVFDEGEGDVGHFLPPVVDDEGMSSTWDLADLGHAGVLLLMLEGSVRDRLGNGVVLLARDASEVLGGLERLLASLGGEQAQLAMIQGKRED